MLELVFNCCYFLLTLAMMCGLYRFCVGPETLDRILAFDFMCGVIIVFIVNYSIQFQTLEYIELILIFCLLGFATIVSFMELFFAKLKRDRND